jgi:hypothetical protein
MEINKFLEFFKKNEIKKIENLSFNYINRKKIVTFVPLKFVDKLTFELSFAGAGKIGNYEMCSFRMKGLGTYKPGNKTKPFSGKKGKLSFEEEVRLELECGEDNLDEVIDALLTNHPYEEVAYEIYDFQKRTNVPTSVLIDFNKTFLLKEIISRINNKIQTENINLNIKINRLCITNNEPDILLYKKMKAKNCSLIAISEKNNIKFKNI